MSNIEVTAEDYYKNYNLEQDPFPVDYVDSVYYATPELEHRLELTKHLVDFSDRILLLTGEKGSGKTAFLQRLKTEAEERWKLTELEITGSETPEEVIRSIYQQNFLDYHPGESIQSCLENLGRHFQNNKNNNLVNVFLVDDAHRLTANVLNLLLQLSGPSASGLLIHLVMMSEEDISSLFLNQDDDFLHKMDMPALSEDQLPVYLRQRLGDAEFEYNEIFTPQQHKQIYKTSGGNPALVNQLAARTLQDPSLFKKTKPGTASVPIIRLLLNGRFTLGLSLVLVTVLVVIILNQDSEQEKEIINLTLPQDTLEPVQAGSSAPEFKLTEPEIIKPAGTSAMPAEATRLQEQSVEAVLPVQAQKEVTQVVSNSDNEVQPVDADTATDTRPQPVIEPALEKDQAGTVEVEPEAPPVVSKTVPEPPVPSTAVPVSEGPGETTGPSSIRGSHWLKQQAPENYVLQLMGAYDPAVIDQMLAANPSIHDMVARFTTVNHNKLWHVLVYGLYPDHDHAVGDIPQLAKNLQALGPWPRSLASIQKDLQ